MKKKQTCKNCEACKCIYVKSLLSFYRTKDMFCTKKEILVAKNGGCGFWSKKSSPPPLTEKFFVRAQENTIFLEKFFSEIEKKIKPAGRGKIAAPRRFFSPIQGNVQLLIFFIADHLFIA